MFLLKMTNCNENRTDFESVSYKMYDFRKTVWSSHVKPALINQKTSKSEKRWQWEKYRKRENRIIMYYIWASDNWVTFFFPPTRVRMKDTEGFHSITICHLTKNPNLFFGEITHVCRFVKEGVSGLEFSLKLFRTELFFLINREGLYI